MTNHPYMTHVKIGLVLIAIYLLARAGMWVWEAV